MTTQAERPPLQAVTDEYEPPAPGQLRRYDLGAVMRANLPPPAVVNGMIYPAKLHTLSGPPEAGKTILSLWLAVQAMRLGHNVMMMDEETGPRQIADILLSFGIGADVIDTHFHYLPFQDLRWRADDLDHLGEFCRQVKPVLAIFDSAAEMLSAAGLDENSTPDVTRFWRQVLRPVAAIHRASVLLLDHDSKDPKPSRYARGSGAKLAAPDVALKIEQLRPFSRSQDGMIRLTVSKDRLGSLHRYWRIQVVSSPLDLRFTRSSPSEGNSSDMSPAAKGLLDVTTDVPADQGTLVDRFAAKFGHGLRRDTASKALTWLLEAGMVDKMDLGHGRSPLWARRGGTLQDQPAETPAGGWPEGTVGAEANK